MSKLWIKLGIACLAIIVVLAFVFSRRSSAIVIGQKMPTVTLEKVDAGSLSLHDGQHQVVLVNFWATWCPPCVLETPSLEKFATEMRPLGVRVIGVSVDQNLPDLERFIAHYHLTYTILRDPDRRIAARFGTYKFPETYVFDRNGRLADKIISAANWNDPRMIRFVYALVHWPPANASGEAKASAASW
jgi:cytochrome c biogenesis protein CcmG, thiol:disulfide interchange protein DsbE